MLVETRKLGGSLTFFGGKAGLRLGSSFWAVSCENTGGALAFFVSVAQYFLFYVVGFVGALGAGGFETGLTRQGGETERERYSSSGVVCDSKVGEALIIFIIELFRLD